ncbi:MAG: hypothetical protein ACK463_29515, partial [Bradyrhizobium sp.]
MTHHDPIGLIAPHAGLAQLNERSRDIFRQIVESYLATGEPVGSRNISRLIALPLSPASVRSPTCIRAATKKRSPSSVG